MKQRLKFKVYIEGMRPIHGKDFNTPLTFIFPGREVRAVDVIDHSGESADRILPAPRRKVVPHGPQRLDLGQRLWVLVSRAARQLQSPHVAEIALSDKFLLNRKDRFTLRVVLSGRARQDTQTDRVPGQLRRREGRPRAAAFLGYLGDGTVKDLLSVQGITPCAGRQESQILAALCAPAPADAIRVRPDRPGRQRSRRPNRPPA